MKTLLLVAIALGVAPLTGTPARAEGSWCAVYSDKDGGGGSNCGFHSYEQCFANIQGVGGVCQPNPWLKPAAEQRKRKRPRD
jgi:hypothetical protein